MRHRQLCAAAHNLADSLSSGYPWLIQWYEFFDIYEEAAAAPDGRLIVDFLNGTITGANASGPVSRIVKAYKDVLPDFCRANGVNLPDFRRLAVQYIAYKTSLRFEVTVEDSRGKTSTVEYEGRPGRRVAVVDVMGRVRPMPPIVSRVPKSVPETDSSI